jgi:hypothetical protein
MTERIRLALDAHADDPAGAAQALRALIGEDLTQFVRAAALLRNERDKPGFLPLVEVLAQAEGISECLSDPQLLDKNSAVDLASRIAEIAPALDGKLVRLLPGRDSDDSDPAKTLQAERILELLDAIADSGRVAPMLAHLTNHPNARLRAKVSLLIARWTPNLRAAEIRLDEKDGRVRANAVESLWGDSSNRAIALLWRAVKDVDNRVVGNALFGLYDLHDQNVIPYIFSMAGHEKPLFRATAAWTMGETKDPQFLPALEKLTHDLYASVRKSAARGMAQMSKQDAQPGSAVAGAPTSQNQ